MSLEELKKDWDALGTSMVQDQLSNEQIKAILKKKHRSYFIKTLILEIPILLIFLYFILLTIFRFDALKINYLEILAIISIAILTLLAILRCVKIWNIYRNGYLHSFPSVVLKKLAKQKVNIQRFYLVNIVLGFVLVIMIIILNIKIYNEYDLIQSNYFWSIIIPGSFLFIIFINRWIRKHYVTAIKEAENLLRSLD